MTKLKNVFLLAAMAVSVVFVACDKEPLNDNEESNNSSGFDGVITATVSGLAIDEVKATIANRETGVEFEVASGKYENGGFTLKLSETVPAQYLKEMFGGTVPAGVKISDANSKFSSDLDITAYKNGEAVGRFVYGVELDDDTGIGGVFVYADRNVTVTGSYTQEDEWNTDIKTYNKPKMSIRPPLLAEFRYVGKVFVSNFGDSFL